MMIHKKNEQRGMVLIVALIMLALITFLVVAFLSFTRLDRSAVTMSVRQTETHLAIDAGLARAQSAVVDEIIGNRNYQVLVSANIDGVAFTAPIPKAELILLQEDPRAPVYYDLDGDRKPDEFRYFLNLNHDLGANKRAAFQPTTTNQVGDPHWIGVLEDPSRPHGKSNRFVARYAYMVTPADKLLDINHAHNNAKILGNEEGYLRGHGNAAWELNLAGSLAMLDLGEFSYDFDSYDQQPDQSSLGEAFRHAGGRHFDQPHFVGLWNYRYPWGDPDTVHPGMPNQREHVDIMNFLRPPHRPPVVGMQPIKLEGITKWLQTDQTGRAFYNLAGAFSTLTAEAPETSKTIDAMGVRLGQPPKVKLLLNEYFSNEDFSENWPVWPMKPSTQVQTNNMLVPTVADTLVFDTPHGFSMGQRVFINLKPPPVGVRTVKRYFGPGDFRDMPPQWFFVNVVDSRRIQLYEIPLRRGSGKPNDVHLVQLMIFVPDKNGVSWPINFINTVPPVEFSFELRYDPLAEKFTRLASLLLDNAMQRQGDAFHIGSDPTLPLFNNEDDAGRFGADNIQVSPPANNNFTPEVHRLLQVALNLTQVYSPDTPYKRLINDQFQYFQLAWPLVFRPILLKEQGDDKVYIAGWRRVFNEVDLGFPVYNLPDALQPDVAWNPNYKLGRVPDRPDVPLGSGNGTTGFPLLIGVNKRTAPQNIPGRIWPSVNEVSTAIRWQVTPHSDPKLVTVQPFLSVAVELRDNLYSHALNLKMVAQGKVTGDLTVPGRPVKNITFPLKLTLPIEKPVNKKTLWPFAAVEFPKNPLELAILPPMTLDAARRMRWSVDKLQVDLTARITCIDPIDPSVNRVIDYANLHFEADLPSQWDLWEAAKPYKYGDQVEQGGQRYYAKNNHVSSIAFDFDRMNWKPAIWRGNEFFNRDEVILCPLPNGQSKLFRCLVSHRAPNVFQDRTSKRLLWEEYQGEVYEMSWQVNDPLVNGVGRDYTLVHPREPNNTHPQIPLGHPLDPNNTHPWTSYEKKYLSLPSIIYLTNRNTNPRWSSNNIGSENYVYRPWSVVKTSKSPSPPTVNPDFTRPWADSYDHTTLKDPGVLDPNYWTFPHEKFGGMETLGWLGMVHRGTPWQSVYLKSKPANRLLIRSIDAVSGVITAGSVPFFMPGDRVKLQGGPLEYQGYEGNIQYDGSALPFSLTLWDGTFTDNLLMTKVGYTHNPDAPLYLISSDAWLRQTGSLDTLPTNDHRLVDLFSTSQSAAAATGLLSVNAKSPAAWGAVLSGVTVPRRVIKNNDGTWGFHSVPHFGNCMDPTCMGYDFRLAPGGFMRGIVRSINRHRGGIPFERVSDILKVSELTDGNPDFLSMINDAQLNTGNMTQLYAQRFFPNEIDYERIPQQILSLLRTDGTPRFVAYTFSQTLKPAQNAVEKDGLCTNYAITSEAAQRTVFRLEGVGRWREYHFKRTRGIAAAAQPPLPRMVVESTTPLILR